jgi:hypothetical protein
MTARTGIARATDHAGQREEPAPRRLSGALHFESATHLESGSRPTWPPWRSAFRAAPASNRGSGAGCVWGRWSVPRCSCGDGVSLRRNDGTGCRWQQIQQGGS